MTTIVWIPPDAPPHAFPPSSTALVEPNGLLAAGGDLRPERLLAAYRLGIFPWYGPGEPILWWSPDPRTVLEPGHVHLSRRLMRYMKGSALGLSLDAAFVDVVTACAAPRPHQPGTWLTVEMQQAYRRLHDMGSAHSVEVWDDHDLVGGIYGIALGRAFFGESMFSRVPNASKIALLILGEQLRRWQFHLFDCQVSSAHLQRMGAVDMPRAVFLERLRAAVAQPDRPGPWRLDGDLLSAPRAMMAIQRYRQNDQSRPRPD